jgi:hypothetical protein
MHFSPIFSGQMSKTALVNFGYVAEKRTFSETTRKLSSESHCDFGYQSIQCREGNKQAFYTKLGCYVHVKMSVGILE